MNHPPGFVVNEPQYGRKIQDYAKGLLETRPTFQQFPQTCRANRVSARKEWSIMTTADHVHGNHQRVVDISQSLGLPAEPVEILRGAHPPKYWKLYCYGGIGLEIVSFVNRVDHSQPDYLNELVTVDLYRVEKAVAKAAHHAFL